MTPEKCSNCGFERCTYCESVGRFRRLLRRFDVRWENRSHLFGVRAYGVSGIVGLTLWHGLPTDVLGWAGTAAFLWFFLSPRLWREPQRTDDHG
jgi:hypothetical protein